MKESFEQPSSLFVHPDTQKEKDELERVEREFGIDSSVLIFAARDGVFTELSDGVWDTLENTDSNRFVEGDWEEVKRLSEKYERDWEDLRQKLEAGTPLDAPIIMQFGDRYHLVSGNTRLMVARAMGLRPKAYIFKIDV